MASKAKGVFIGVYFFRIQGCTVTLFPYSLFKCKLMSTLHACTQTELLCAWVEEVQNHTCKYNLRIELIFVRPSTRYSIDGYASLPLTSSLGIRFVPAVHE